MKPRRSLAAERGGNATLEFALTAPCLFLLVLFILGAGALLWSKGVMQLVAAETARCTAIGSSSCASPPAFAASLITAWGIGGLVPSLSVAVQSSTTCNSTPGHFSVVTITGTVSEYSLVGAIGLPTTLSVSACYPSGT